MISPSLLTDRYQLTMLAAYARTGHASRRAVFELFIRKLPVTRRYMIACGIGRAVEMLGQVRFTSDELAWLEADPFLGPTFGDPKVRSLFESLRFRGRVVAVPEGRVCYPGEPLVRVEGTLAEAQLVETLLLSIVNHDTRVASKSSRIVHVAQGRPCFEFGTRRAHELSAVDAARAAYVAGFTGTSNETAARRYGLPIAGTMAHSFVLAHCADLGEAGEIAAFRDLMETFEGSKPTFLVDTFETLRGVDRAIEVAGEQLGGVRIDSGELAALAFETRKHLDAKGLRSAKIFLSDDLDEYRIDALVRSGVPVDSFGVGTMAVTTPDAPSLGGVFKLVAIEDDRGELVAVQKRSTGKGSSAAPKQVFRKHGTLEDVIGVADEDLGEPLLVPVFDGRAPVGDCSALAARKRREADLALATPELLSIQHRRDDEGFPVGQSDRLHGLQDRVAREGRAPLR